MTRTTASLTSSPARQRTAKPSWRQWNLIGLTCLAAYCTGLSWQGQLVSYPLFRAVGPGEFLAYHARYNETIPWVVVVPGFVTFLSMVAFSWTRPNRVPRTIGAIVSASGLVALFSTVLWAIPRHDELDRIGQSGPTIDSLLAANLIRSLAITAGTLALAAALPRLIVERSG